MDGTGSGGEASGEIKWSPSHGISPAEEAKRRERAEKHLGKALDALYKPSGEYEHED